jgi:hypothetical protein
MTVWLFSMVQADTDTDNIVDCEFGWHQENYTTPRERFYSCRFSQKSVQVLLDNKDLDDSGEDLDNGTDVRSNGDVDSEYDKVTMVQAYHPLKLSEIPDSLFNVFDNMEYLVIYHTGLNEIDQEDFENATNLKYLRLHSNDISEITENTFLGAESLEYINLSFNQIQVIHENAFKGPTNVKEIHLNHNKISMIFFDAFSHHPDLTVINLRDNVCIKERFEKYVDYLEIVVLETDLRKRKCHRNYVMKFGGIDSGYVGRESFILIVSSAILMWLI